MRIKQSKRQIKNEIGNRFGRLLVTNFGGVVNHYAMWLCRCDCGNEKLLKGSELRTGKIISCGCFAKEQIGKTHFKHGHARKGKNSTTFRAWQEMHRRCSDKNRAGFKNYGGRGISVCEQWENFAQFLNDMGECPKGKSLGRRDNNGHYEPSNCRWETRQEQNWNTRKTRLFMIGGISKNILQISKETGLPTNAISQRFNNGWTTDEVYKIPYGVRRKNKASITD